MPLLTVTLGAGATQFTTQPLRAMQMKVWQGADASFIGDSSTVTTSTGIPVIAASTTIPPLVIGPFTSGAINLNKWYGIGTTADVIHIQYTPEE
jgi:hypothetical protein